MNNIQRFIDDLKFEKEKAQSIVDSEPEDQSIIAAHYEGKVKAFSFSITQAELLLKQQPNNDVPPQLNKHDVMRSVCECEVPYFPNADIEFCSKCNRPTAYTQTDG